jgi:hypothetical protein
MSDGRHMNDMTKFPILSMIFEAASSWTIIRVNVGIAAPAGK